MKEVLKEVLREVGEVESIGHGRLPGDGEAVRVQGVSLWVRQGVVQTFKVKEELWSPELMAWMLTIRCSRPGPLFFVRVGNLPSYGFWVPGMTSGV